jgi:hypothetical protein
LNSEGFRETFLRSDRKGPKKAGRRQAHVVKQRIIEKKPEVPQEQRTPQKRTGEEEPRRRSSDRNKNKRLKLEMRKTPCM